MDKICFKDQIIQQLTTSYEIDTYLFIILEKSFTTAGENFENTSRFDCNNNNNKSSSLKLFGLIVNMNQNT